MRINPYQTWIGITITLLVALVSTGLFYGLLYTVSFGNVIKIIELRPKILTYSYEFSLELVKSYAYSKEMIYTRDISIQNITQNHVLFVDPEALFQKSVNLLIHSFNNHRRLIQEEGLMDDYIIDVLLGKHSTVIPYLALGLEYSHNAYITDLINLSRIQLNSESGNIVESYHVLFHNIMEAYLNLSNKALDLLNERLSEQVSMNIMWILVYDAFLSALYVIGVFAGTNKVKKVITRGWSFFNDLHIGDLESD